jgi:hypothetical protein
MQCGAIMQQYDVVMREEQGGRYHQFGEVSSVQSIQLVFLHLYQS